MSALAGMLFCMGLPCFGAEGDPPPKPNPDVPAPSDDQPPPNPPAPVPDTTGATTTPPPPSAPLVPRPATFSDFVPAQPAAASDFKSFYPVLDNKVSSVANQLVRDTANESIFKEGSGPTSGTFDTQTANGEPPLLRSGPFVFHTSLTVESILSDNYFGSPHGSEVSWLKNFTPGFTLSYMPNANTQFDGFYSATLHNFQTNVVPNYYDESAGVAIKISHFGAEGLTFSLTDTYNQVGNTIINPLVSAVDLSNLEIKVGTRYETNALPISLRFVEGPLTLEGIYEYDIQDYFDNRNYALDTQQHTGTIRGAYDVTPGHFALIGECNFNYTDYPSAQKKDFDFATLFTGVRGTYDALTYEARTGYCLYDALGSGRIDTRPFLATDVKYTLSKQLDFTVFGTRSLETGVLTGETKTDSYGGMVDIHPMLRGLLTLSYVWQGVIRTTGLDTVETAELDYTHTIRGWMSPRLGMKYSVDSLENGPPMTTWTGLAGMGFKLKPRMTADLDYYHEVLFGPGSATRVTDRWSANYGYTLNHFSSVTFGYDRAMRRDSQAHGKVKFDEMRMSISLKW